MAEAVWNGSLRLSLVSCPIYLSAATSSSKRIKLDLLSARTGNPVTEQYVDARTGDVVATDATVKGYQFEKSRYVTVTEDDLGKLGSGLGNIIDLEQFVPRDQVDRLYIDASCYIHPEGQLAADTLHALRLGMERSGRAALGLIRMGESEVPALIEPYRGGLMISPLRTQDELAATEFVDRPDSEISSEMVEIAETLINRRAAEFDPAKLRDHFQDDLRKLVEEKVKGAPPAPAPAIEERRPRLVPAPEASPPAPEPLPTPEPPVAESVVAAPPPVPEPPAPEPPPVPESAVAVPEPPPEPVVAAPPPPPEPPAPEPPPEPEPDAAAAPPPPAPELPLAPEPPPEPAVAAVVPPPTPEPPPSTAEGSTAELAAPAGPHDVGTEI